MFAAEESLHRLCKHLVCRFAFLAHSHWLGGDAYAISDKERHQEASTHVLALRKCAMRPPVTIDLYALRNGLDLSNSLDAAVWAVACVAFWPGCRLDSEPEHFRPHWQARFQGHASNLRGRGLKLQW